MTVDRVLIGSSAVEERHPGLLGRAPKDLDYLALEPVPGADFIDGEGILDTYSFSEEVASLDEVYTLKVSHSPWVFAGLKNWHKHLTDIRRLSDTGAELVPELHRVAYKTWEVRKGKKLVNLNKTREEFFTSAVVRFYDHDSVHAAVSLGHGPAFLKILADGSEVKTDERKFATLPTVLKEHLVFEETFVLALERELVPNWKKSGEEPLKGDLFEAYARQLRLLATQYSKGWFSQFIIENYTKLNQPPLDYWVLFQESDKKVSL